MYNYLLRSNRRIYINHYHEIIITLFLEILIIIILVTFFCFNSVLTNDNILLFNLYNGTFFIINIFIVLYCLHMNYK